MIHHFWEPRVWGQHKVKETHVHTLYPKVPLPITEFLWFLRDLHGKVVNLEVLHQVPSLFGVQFHRLVEGQMAPHQEKRPQNPAINQE